MDQTFKTFREIAELYEGNTNCLTKLAINYQSTYDDTILAVIFVKYYPFILSQTSKYFYLTDSDKASFAVEELQRTLIEFDPTRKTKIQTLYATYLNRRLRKETQALNYDKRKANYYSDSWDTAMDTKAGYEDSTYSEIEFISMLESSNIFTANELRYAKERAKDESSSDSDIASKLGVSSSAVSQIKKSLKKKLLPFLKAELLLEY